MGGAINKTHFIFCRKTNNHRRFPGDEILPFKFVRDEGLCSCVRGMDVKNGARISGKIKGSRIKIVGCEIVDSISRHSEEERGKAETKKN